jgi:hypothetical protein
MSEASQNKRVVDFLATTGTLFIGGERREAVSGRTFNTPNPATGERFHPRPVPPRNPPQSRESSSCTQSVPSPRKEKS